MIFELDGFLERPEEIDGSIEEFNAYNWCLANDYYIAVLNEDFDKLGDSLNNLFDWHYIMNNVCRWLNYDGEIGKDIKDDFAMLHNGTIQTYNNRTFIEAALEHGWDDLANNLINENNNTKKLKYNRNVRSDK